ncbi:MBL fold metallo-hydrolase [Tepidibacillus infernus]|uniref:Metallo-beta-lactamase domain-containing protein n=1 Tax=Tepidibacillus decaturensis TaxID=1413211 RepID=A0A135L394_9BACI|nr:MULTISPECIES: MBL fold metallo-hydrolase [Tepidibacillus]KXG43466.1 hypothetical protein U473_05150 [Tepidibacillus decaturensis]GBF11331.1 ribonuclease Z [Tepidibacillus sp. HK-1]
MKVTVIGYQSPYPGPDHAGPGFLLEHEKKYYLIDVGSGVLSRLQKMIDLNKLDAVFISHLHHDHMSDFLVLQYAIQMQFIMERRTKPLPVYFPGIPNQIADLIPFQHFIDPHIIDEQTLLYLNDLEISFLRTEHAVPCFAMKFKTREKTFVYGADSGTGTKWSPFADQTDLLILECTYMQKDRPARPSAHLATSDVAEISQWLKPKQLLLTHFYPKYDPKEIEKEVVDYGVLGTLHLPEFGKVVFV